MEDMKQSEYEVYCAIMAGPQSLKQYLLDHGVPLDKPPCGEARTLLETVVIYALALAGDEHLPSHLPSGVTKMLCENFGEVFMMTRVATTVTEELVLNAKLDAKLKEHPIAEDLQEMVRAGKWDQVLKRTATMSRDDFCALLGFLYHYVYGDDTIKLDRRYFLAFLGEICRYQVIPEYTLLNLMSAWLHKSYDLFYRVLWADSVIL